VGNADITLVAEAPKINPYIDPMKAVLTPILGISPDALAIKATTNEGMGFVGRKEGICAWANVLIYRPTE
jgi:2-C-methyl-D-erythritol 2,4-cyclodiphosphate synthase